MIDISMLQVGDKIRVVNIWPVGGRQNNSGLMDKYLGQILTVREIVPTEKFCRVLEDMSDRNYSPTEKGWAWYSELIDEIVFDKTDEMDDVNPASQSELRAFLGL